MRVKKGMQIDQIRCVWHSRAEAKTKAIMDSYYARRSGSGGREGLGIYGMYQERAAREKVRLAVKLLAQAGLEVSYQSIHKVTGQSMNTIRHYWAPPRQSAESNSHVGAEDHRVQIIRFSDVAKFD